jgi:hypothetical protein
MSAWTRSCSTCSRQDWSTVRLLLHPYLQWTQDGLVLRGRTKVMARLTAQSRLAAPATCELRDGQIYRWTAP